jgi:hypothetical protein
MRAFHKPHRGQFVESRAILEPAIEFMRLITLSSHELIIGM